MKTQVSRRTAAALTLIELVVVLGALGMLVAIILPALAKAKTGPRIRCADNLRMLGISFHTWAGDMQNLYPMQVSVTNGGAMERVPLGYVFPHFLVMSNEVVTPKSLRCPNDTTRTNAIVFAGLTDWNISYFLAVDTRQSSPSNILIGDANLLVRGRPIKRGLFSPASAGIGVSWTTDRHHGDGNICLNDCSVQTTRSAVITNRLAIP